MASCGDGWDGTQTLSRHGLTLLVDHDEVVSSRLLVYQRQQ